MAHADALSRAPFEGVSDELPKHLGTGKILAISMDFDAAVAVQSIDADVKKTTNYFALCSSLQAVPVLGC